MGAPTNWYARPPATCPSIVVPCTENWYIELATGSDVKGTRSGMTAAIAGRKNAVPAPETRATV
jgi:hypothetical protein